MSVDHPPQVLFFDVFGTVVEWRDSVSKALSQATQRALTSPDKTLTQETRAAASAITPEDWLAFTEEWRKSYKQFTRSFDPSSNSEFISVDQHHFASLRELLQKWNIQTLFTDEEILNLALSWHRLDPWPDTVKGLEQLNRKFHTCTLSNGNVSLLEDLSRYASLPFTHIVSAEQFGAYKPSPKVYLGAAGKFGVDPKDCALVAAHLYDLKAAKAVGFQTIFVERALEEPLVPEHTAQVEQGGYVDMWVGRDTDGFLEVAGRFEI